MRDAGSALRAGPQQVRRARAASVYPLHFCCLPLSSLRTHGRARDARRHAEDGLSLANPSQRPGRTLGRARAATLPSLCCESRSDGPSEGKRGLRRPCGVGPGEIIGQPKRHAPFAGWPWNSHSGRATHARREDRLLIAGRLFPAGSGNPRGDPETVLIPRHRRRRQPSMRRYVMTVRSANWCARCRHPRTILAVAAIRRVTLGRCLSFAPAYLSIAPFQSPPTIATSARAREQ